MCTLVSMACSNKTIFIKTDSLQDLAYSLLTLAFEFQTSNFTNLSLKVGIFKKFILFVAQWDLSTIGRMAVTSGSAFFCTCSKVYGPSILICLSVDSYLLSVFKKILQNLWAHFHAPQSML